MRKQNSPTILHQKVSFLQLPIRLLIKATMAGPALKRPAAKRVASKRGPDRRSTQAKAEAAATAASVSPRKALLRKKLTKKAKMRKSLGGVEPSFEISAPSPSPGRSAARASGGTPSAQSKRTSPRLSSGKRGRSGDEDFVSVEAVASLCGFCLGQECLGHHLAEGHTQVCIGQA